MQGAERVALGPWARFSAIERTVRRPPYLGEHNLATFGALGVTEAEQSALRDGGIL
jgi:crotonobetainyl-CoA:carnitine CoA-transferase CaiB-like acyl-CoA transferase